MSIRQTLRQEFLQQGMQTRNLEIARNMLFKLHLGMDVVQKATGLARAKLQQLQAGVDEGFSWRSCISLHAYAPTAYYKRVLPERSA